MKPINEIYADFLLGKVRFHRAIESDLFRDALMFHSDSKFSTSAALCAILYEMIFTTRLVRETANPPGFVPGKDNLDEQFQNLYDREDDIINVKKMAFRQITSELLKLGVITSDDKAEYDDFYSAIRNPVAHGLTFRLFEPMLGRAPSHALEVDTNNRPVYEKASHILIDKIYCLMTLKVLRKL
jgi:hypothetical protein